jgi:hypothetical protein
MVTQIGLEVICDMDCDKSSKSPWYVWFSLAAFFVLYIDSGNQCRSCSINDKKFNTWISYCGQGFWWLFAILVSGIPFLIFYKLFGYNLGVHIFQLIAIYFIGVFITTKHVAWRKKHLG